jgi:hypothetical protein
LDSKEIEESYLIIDVNSRTTKAVLIEKSGQSHKIASLSEAPTTIGPPELDVTIGIQEAINQIEVQVDKLVWSETGPIKGTDLLCSSSTSGGLHMVVVGLVRNISGESAERAALGAGALLMDQFSIDDPRPEYKQVERLRSLQPDILLFAGGTDGGAVNQVLDMAGLIRTADVQPRFGGEFALPLLFAGNVDIRDQIRKTLNEGRYAARMVENVRPLINKENLGPAREGIYDTYMEHVLIHSPGYNKLQGWTTKPILPTQAVIGQLLFAYAEMRGINLIGVDIGGDTTDVYSVYEGVFNRSLNADIGLTYGISNVMKSVGVSNILRWLPAGTDEREIRNLIGNMMIKETYELTETEILIQGVVAREAIRLGKQQHRKIANRLKGVLIERSLAEIFNQAIEVSYIDMMKTHAIIAKGQVFKDQSLEEVVTIILDGLEPEGVTELYIDNSSIMAQLGSLLRVNREAALEIFVKDSLYNLGTILAPVGNVVKGEKVLTLKISRSECSMSEHVVKYGDFTAIPLKDNTTAEILVTPHRKIDIGNGRGKPLKRHVTGGAFGLICDARGRPLKTFRESLSLSHAIKASENGR